MIKLITLLGCLPLCFFVNSENVCVDDVKLICPFVFIRYPSRTVRGSGFGMLINCILRCPLGRSIQLVSYFWFSFIEEVY